MPPLPLVIINPASASGATRRAWPAVASDLRTHFGPFSCAFSKRRGDVKRLAAEGAREGRPLIIACGGDGTISDVANGILESGEDAEMAVMPSGTGGDFRRTIAMPTRTASAARAIRDGRTRRIDAGRVTYHNSAGHPESRYFIGVASFGMSGGVIERVKAGGPKWLSGAGPRALSGRLTFAVAALQTTLASPNATVYVGIDDGRERRITVANFCVANARYFGGGMKIAPEAKLDDGRFDVVAVGDLSAAEILFNAPQLYLGTHLGIERVSHTHAKRVTARPAKRDDVIAIEVDGELPGRLPATFEILASALRVRFPPVDR